MKKKTQNQLSAPPQPKISIPARKTGFTNGKNKGPRQTEHITEKHAPPSAECISGNKNKSKIVNEQSQNKVINDKEEYIVDEILDARIR